MITVDSVILGLLVIGLLLGAIDILLGRLSPPSGRRRRH